MDLDGGSDNTIDRERDEDKHAARQDGLARRRRPHPRDIGRTGGAHSALNRHKVKEGHKGHSGLTEPTSCQYKFPQGPEARKRASERASEHLLLLARLRVLRVLLSLTVLAWRAYVAAR